MVGPPTLTIDERNALRATLRARRKAFVSADSSTWMASPTLLNLITGAACVGSYVAMNSEVDPYSLTKNLAAVALPRLSTCGASMTFHKWSEGDVLEKARHNLLQPLSNSPTVTPDLILTPLVGFDRQGNRLGQGAGHYDRYFERNHNALRIGLAWSAQQMSTYRSATWDVPLDAIQTESKWIVPNGSRLTS